NTDGSVILSQGSAAVGGVLRGADSRFVVAFDVNLGGGSITDAELAGINYDLRLAWDGGVRKLIVQKDSAAAIALLQSDQTSHPHHTLVNSIKRQLNQQWEVHIMHAFRESNYVADYLASVGHSIRIGIRFVDNPSATLNHWLYFDLLGLQTPRIINI
ncbi:unnamed protein product, partial [Linum tenue]